jgi:hypothetical protein
VRRTAVTLAALLATTTAHAQASIFSPSPYVVDPEGEAPLYKRKFLPPAGWMPADQRMLLALSAPIVPAALAPPPEPTVMNGGRGGMIGEHHARFWALKQRGAAVEMRGGCYSACTLITSYIPKERLCFGEGSFLAFHSARAPDSARPQLQSTLEMYISYPTEIRHWIDRNGGPYKLTVESYWTMYDRDLWAIGYPRCK